MGIIRHEEIIHNQVLANNNTLCSTFVEILKNV